MDGYQLQPLLDQFDWDTASFYPEFEYDGKEAFIHLISYKYGRDYYAVQKMEEELTPVRDFPRGAPDRDHRPKPPVHPPQQL